MSGTDASATRRAISYRLVLPRPWVRLPVGRGLEERARDLVEEAASRLPKDAPPDQVGPWKRELQRRIVADVRRAREYGGIDFYLPSDTMDGFLMGASFVVSEITPPGVAPEDPDAAVGGVLAELASADGAKPVSVADTVWVRIEKVVGPDQAQAAGVDVPTRRVTYATAVPGDPQRWLTVAFSCVGDGDPDGEAALVSVELFDAIMSTWRWIHEDDDWPAD